MEILIKNLEKYLQSLNIEQLYKDPGHKNSKDWLAGVTAELKVSGRHSYKEFKDLSQHMYPSIPLATRKHAAEQIDVLLRIIIAQYKAENTAPPLYSKSSESINNNYPYVNKNILDGFRVKKNHFNYQKLITLIEELNFNYQNDNTYSSCMVLRAILDHIPPLLSKRNFDDVVNQYNWGSEKSSERKAIKKLQDFRNIPDSVLHGQITDKNDIIDLSYLPNKFYINTLLQSCLQSDIDFTGIKSAKTNAANYQEVRPDLIIDFDEKKVSWANYAVSRWVWSSFRLVLTINNISNKSAEYIRVFLKANSIDGLWEARNFMFLNREDENKSNPNEDIRVEAGYKEKISLFVSPYKIGDNNQKKIPDIDRDTLTLVAETESGKIIELPIKAGWICTG